MANILHPKSDSNGTFWEINELSHSLKCLPCIGTPSIQTHLIYFTDTDSRLQIWIDWTFIDGVTTQQRKCLTWYTVFMKLHQDGIASFSVGTVSKLVSCSEQIGSATNSWSSWNRNWMWIIHVEVRVRHDFNQGTEMDKADGHGSNFIGLVAHKISFDYFHL
jgi:hypothetical protein